MKSFHKITLLVIILLSLALRSYRIDSVPPGVNRDEASIGFTAYSLLKSGKDEYGRFLPLSFQSFGDWKLPLYIYASVPWVAILGKTETSVRIVSIIAGTATVGVTYFFVTILLRRPTLGLLSALLVSIAPWHLHLSRVESEANVAVLLTTVGIFFILKSFEKPVWWYGVLGSILLALTYYTYHGSHIETTLLLGGFLFIYWKDVRLSKHFPISAVCFLLLVGFILSQTLLVADIAKISGISIFGDKTVVHEGIELPRNDHAVPSLLPKLLHNRLTYALEVTFRNYLSAFSPEFLFISGGRNRAHNIENFGNLYIVEAPFLLLGVLVCILNRKRKAFQLLGWWILISPVAATITKDAPHTNRMFAIFPAISVVVALGIAYFTDVLVRVSWRQVAIVGVVFVYSMNIALYLDRYYVHFPTNESANWGIGYKKLIEILRQSPWNEKSIVMANPAESPYIYLLFLGDYDPLLYQQKVDRYPPTEDGFFHVRSFDRFAFRSIDWEKDSFLPNHALIDYYDRIPQAYQVRAVRVAQFGLLPTSEPTIKQ